MTVFKFDITIENIEDQNSYGIHYAKFIIMHEFYHF